MGPAETDSAALSRIFELSLDMICTAGFDGYFRRVNPAFERVLGYSPDELLGRPFLDFVHPDDRESTLAEADRLAQGSRETIGFENRYRCKDGSYRWLRWNVSSSAEDGLIYAIARDVTERKRMEQAHAGLAAIVNSSDDAIIAKTLDGVITSWNRSAERMYGYTAGEAIGRPMAMLAPPEHEDELSGMLEQMRHGKPVDHLETVRMAKDGRRVDVSVTLSPVRDEAGHVTGASVIARDITERKQVEDEREAANAALEQANRELEAFSYSVSHDLRAPLRTVDGFARILVEEFGSSLPAEGHRYLSLVRSGTEQMGRLIDSLLTFSHLGRQELRKRPTSTRALVQEALDLLAADRDGRPVELVLGELPSCEADPALLKQVFVNLISNAIKYSSGRTPALIEVGSQEAEGERAWYVRDNGVGFDMKYADRLFGVFQRLHRSEEYEGAGIGLATAERIVSRHGGRIWAEAETERGATFYFTLGRKSDG